MFDIGFTELVLVGVIGLLILGPERMPVAVRTVGLWVGKIKRTVGGVQKEIQAELRIDEIRKKADENRKAIEDRMAELQQETDIMEAPVVVVIMFFKLFSCFTVVFHEQLYIRCSVLVFVFLMTLYVFVSFQFVSFITVFAVSICVMVKYVIVHICVIVLMSVSCFTVFSMSVIFSCANFSVVYVSVIQLRSCVSIIFCVSFSVYSISVCMLFRLISGCVSSVMSCVSFSLSCLECFQELFVSSFTLYVVIQFCICLVSSLPFVTTMVLKFITVIMFS